MMAQWLSLVWQVLWGIGTLLALLIVWWIKRWAAPKTALEDVNNRLTRIEERVAHLPTDHDLVDVRDALGKLGAQIAQLSGEQRAATRLVEHMNQYLMERGR
ncbi:MAG: DUF2730 family protein [Bradyrhizobium sp.]|nr:DUF2730 family protein [Bradyrhizobium sp.]